MAAMAAVAAWATASADVTTVKTLYSGDPVDVTWENTLTIGAENFADGVEVGDYLYITFTKTTDVIEIKADGRWVPGSIKTFLGDNTPDFKAYITTDMLAALRQYGVEICGASFTVSGVSVCKDDFTMPEGAIWAGYFWIDTWTTMDLFKTAFDNYDGQRYMDIYLSGESDGSYFMQVMTAFDTPSAVWGATNSETRPMVEHTATKAVIDLQGIDVKAALADVNALLIQGNKEGSNPFNITAIALRADNTSTSINVVDLDAANAPVNVYNFQGMLVKSCVSLDEALGTLPAGIYIANGRKYVVR